MSEPTVSFIINRDPQTNEPIVGHTLNGPNVQNSHGVIAQNTGIVHGTSLCVEIEPRELAATSNKEPVPWQIDRLPDGKQVIEDVDKELLEASENAARSFMTPENVYAYIHTRCRSTEHFVKHVFKDEYYQKWLKANPKAHSSGNYDPDGSSYLNTILTAVMGKASALTREASTVPCPTIPMFTLDDIVNPATWYKLPDA